MLYRACILTAAIEMIVFAASGYYRDLTFMLLVASANVATNLMLNLILSYHRSAALIVLLELAVVAAEYLVYAKSEGHSKKLFLITAGANAASFLTGLALFGI